jgi:hypothetical protein
LKKCVKIGNIGFKNSKFELTPPLRESLSKYNVSKLDQRFSLKKDLPTIVWTCKFPKEIMVFRRRLSEKMTNCNWSGVMIGLKW